MLPPLPKRQQAKEQSQQPQQQQHTVVVASESPNEKENDGMEPVFFRCPDTGLLPKFPDGRSFAITLAAVNIARDIGARAIVCATRSGQTPRMVARNRPAAPILSLTTTQRALDYAAFVWGVQAVTEPSVLQNTDLLFEAAETIVKERGLAASGDGIVIVAGVPLGTGSGTTNMIKVQQVH